MGEKSTQKRQFILEAAIEKAKKAAGERGMLLDSSIIANPDGQLWDSIL